MEKAHSGALARAAEEHEGRAHKGKSRVHKMEIRRTHPKGYIAQHVEHRFADGAADKERDQAEGGMEHALPDQAALQQHITENMGAPGGEAGEGAAPEAGGE